MSGVPVSFFEASSRIQDELSSLTVAELPDDNQPPKQEANSINPANVKNLSLIHI